MYRLKRCQEEEEEEATRARIARAGWSATANAGSVTVPETILTSILWSRFAGFVRETESAPPVAEPG